MGDNVVTANCIKCGENLLEGKERLFEKVDWHANALQEKSETEIAEELWEDDSTINIDGLDSTPVANPLGKFDIDTQSKISEVNVTMEMECPECGAEVAISIESNSSRDGGVNLQMRLRD